MNTKILYLNGSSSWNAPNITPSVTHQAAWGDATILDVDYISPSLSIALGSFGLIFNAINTKVFVKQGVKDCVTLGFLSLSLTDNGSLLFGLIAAGCRIFKAHTASSGEHDFVDPMSVWLLLVQGQFCFYDLSTYTTAFIAVERCLCVILPFRFKLILTMRKSMLVLMGLYLSTFLFHVFFFAYSEFRTVYNPQLNTSQLFLYYNTQRRLLEKYLQVFNHLCLSCVALLVILITTILMLMGLQKSNELRKNTLSTIHARKHHIIQAEISVGESTNVANTQEANSDKNHAKDDCKAIVPKYKPEFKGVLGRNRRVAKMVSSLAIICFVCDSLRFAAMLSFYVDLELRQGSSKAVAFSVLSGVVYLVQIVNCSVNIIVYLTSNPSYRQVFVSIFYFKVEKKNRLVQDAMCNDKY